MTAIQKAALKGYEFPKLDRRFAGEPIGVSASLRRFFRKSPFTGELHSMDLVITVEQYNVWLSGIPIQTALPHLNADEREFLMTGITPSEWESMTS